MLKTISILLLISNLALAQDAVYLNKDDKAPFEGYLTTPAKTKDLYNVNLERNSLQKQLDLSQKDNALKDEKTNLLLDQNTKLAKTAYDSQSLSTWEKIGYFTLGVLATSGAIYAAKKITQ